MFKKAGDNVHYLERTGSHSTKGLANGMVDVRKMDESDFNSPQNVNDRWAQIKILIKTCKRVDKEVRQLTRDIVDLDDDARKVMWEEIRSRKKFLNKVAKEIESIRSVTPKYIPVFKVPLPKLDWRTRKRIARKTKDKDERKRLIDAARRALV